MQRSIVSPEIAGTAAPERKARPAAAELAAGSGLRIDAFETIEAAARPWQALERNAGAGLFQSHAWARAWAATAGPAHGEDIEVFVGYLDGVPVLLNTFAIKRDGLSRIAFPIGGIHAAECGGLYAPELLSRPDGARLIADARRVIAGRLSAGVILEPCLGEAALMAETTIARRGLAFAGSLPDPVQLCHLAPWEVFDPAHRKSRHRAEDRRSAARLSRIAPVRFEVTTDPAACAAALGDLLRQKSLQFRAAGIPDRYGDPAVVAFFERLATVGAGTEPILGTLHVGERVAATIFSVGFGETVFGLVTAISDDAELRRGAPGFVAFEKYLQALCEGGRYRTVDFGVGDNGLKERWCDDARPLSYRYEIIGPSGITAGLGAAATEIAKRTVKANPRLAGFYRRLRRHVAERRTSPRT
ncbi:GNAT family N-acetyltransferase [Rhodobium gokarnense]|uniref:CelD/BcsL family acetyltransferase involved in cellulose biosynthesis n=1 Tax=Rhodobium gokarnense TaxID=364296 RepID=A0ABT3H6X7_9HYPH|nr:GNAT family N-acetyltransferase [Rhodobium gokarnense]MCW2306157.1 CelD/BcsL family acetyltransferase involved in cellulose biosynthesis [Rhodobium gokarnense]